MNGHDGVMVNTNEPVPAGWAVLDHSCNDRDLPAPFDALDLKSNNVGASVWVYLSTGAMVAAIPTGPWKEQAQFDFFYAAPGAAVALRMAEWSKRQEQWDGSSVVHCNRLHEAAVTYFNAAISGKTPSAHPLSAVGL
ncbi:Uncharacterised protein [Mycobacteroides abscessus subsp. abscessus]|nr:Uncharacterised protein [Mycobacteroides abscessus subsp. abscessus]SIM83552.1 Uncharacterised protein [Mycobacteroides abscessus subsp. abscessus]